MYDIYIVKNILKTRTNKHKQADVLLYVNDGWGLNNCYSIKCNKQQEKYCVSRAKIGTLGGVDKIGIGPDRTGLDHESDHGSDHRKKRFQRKKIQKNQIVYELVIVGGAVASWLVRSFPE